jgi:energy-coupling factor transporter ATP-binding protein EcfA2
MPTSGPTKLVFINAAKFSYAEVALTQPLHLVGPNNVGKTTLVNILQLLYIDKESHMSFPGYSWAETKAYYFPDRRSYVLFECQTPQGKQVVGAYGKGPAEAHDIQRFAYSGAFEKTDFLTSTEQGSVPRKVDEVTQTLSLNDYRELEARNLRAALTGIGDSGGLNLGLIPVQDHDGYAKFRDLFKGLIRLRQLDQNALKERLCSTYASEVDALTVNLRDAHEEDFTKMRRYRREIAELERHEADIEEALRCDQRQSELRRQLTEDWIQLVRANGQCLAALRGKQEGLQREIRQMKSALGDVEKRKEELDGKRDELNQSLGALRREKKKLTNLIEQFSDFDAEAVRDEIDELEDKRSQILADLKSVDADSPEQIQTRRDRVADQIDELQQRLNDLQDLMGPLLKRRFGEERLKRFFRILNPRLLALNADGEDIVLGDLDTLVQSMEAQEHRFDDGQWHFPGGHLSLSGLPPPEVADYTDPERIRNELETCRAKHERLNHRLEIARDASARERRAEKIEDRLTKLRSELSRYEKAKEAEEKLQEVRSKITARTRELESTKEALADTEAKSQQLRDKKRRCRAQLESIRENAEEMRERVRTLDSPPSDWSRHLMVAGTAAPTVRVDQSPVRDPAESGNIDENVLALADRYQDEKDEEARVAQTLEQTLGRIHQGTYEQYRQETRAETLDVLADEKEGLEARRRAAKQLWQKLMTGLGRKISDLLSSLDTMKEVVSRINRRLRGTSVSDLERLRLEITPFEPVINLLERVAEYDAVPLFGEPETRKEDLGKLEDLFHEHPEIHLRDLFTVGFSVTTVDGSTEKYDGLDNIQSNGTSITIKVLVHLVLINDLLRDGALKLPFYLDEASSLDESNLGGIVRASTEMGFIPVLASPSESTSVRHVYYLQSDGEQVYLGPDHRVELRQKGAASPQERRSSVPSGR